jgi:hypothetical protein
MLTAAATLLVLVGCAHTGAYNAGYLAAARRPVTAPCEGRVLVVTTEQENAYVYNGHPTSLTGAGTTLVVPLGVIQKTYASGPVEGPSYMLNTSPQEEIVKVTHKAVYDVMTKAAADVSAELVASRATPAATEAR